MAIYVCIEPVSYGRIQYEKGQEMVIKDELINIAEQDKIISEYFKLKGTVEEKPPIENPQRPKAMSEVDANPPDLLRKVEKGMSAEEEADKVLNEVKRGRGRPKGGR